MKAVARLTLACSLALPPTTAAAQTALPLRHQPETTKPAITAADLMSRLYVYADDSMMGRATGTEYNLKATAYIAAEVRRLGLVPAGDSGGYFQNVPLVKRELDPQARLAVDGATLRLWEDYLPRDQGGPTRPIDGAQAVFAGAWGDTTMLAPEQAAGKLVVLAVPRRPNPGQPGWFVPRAGVTARYRTAAGIAIVSLDIMPPQLRDAFRAAGVTLKEDAPPTGDPLPTYLYVTAATASRLVGAPVATAAAGTAGKTVQGGLAYVEAAAPARNVVAILPGADPKLKGEFVAIGAHNDHIGFNNTPVDHDSLRAFNTAMRRLVLAAPDGRPTPAQIAAIHVNVDSLRKLRPARRDSIANGADDDGSGTVTVLEIAEQLANATPRPKRSILFVWHTGEELGLFGSQWFTDHPTVPRDSIVAQLNMDMVGRGRAGEEKLGGPAYLQLIGSRRLSTELGNLVESVNKTERQPFTFDYQYDAPGHPEQYYCRSDHYMYARYGIPITFFSTGDHQDYHEVTDEPQYIDYDHMARVGQLVYDIARAVANLDHRIVVDKPKPDPRGQCVQ
ncbi:MAG TPA: M20/M25/M40 family metallo-hydrolase [Gemmatimonadales bacterium]